MRDFASRYVLYNYVGSSSSLMDSAVSHSHCMICVSFSSSSTLRDRDVNTILPTHTPNIKLHDLPTHTTSVRLQHLEHARTLRRVFEHEVEGGSLIAGGGDSHGVFISNLLAEQVEDLTLGAAIATASADPALFDDALVDDLLNVLDTVARLGFPEAGHLHSMS